MNSLKRLCVFCGSSSGTNPEYAASAQALGRAIGDHGLELVYGGGRVGLMGEVANALLDVGGTVIGVMPHGLVAKEIAHNGITKLIVVDSMHERKAMMADLADAFVALPGGYGTLDEFFEIVTWSQIGHHQKACALLNTHGYFDKLIDFVDHAVDAGFILRRHRDMIIVAETPNELITKLQQYKHTAEEKWSTTPTQV